LWILTAAALAVGCLGITQLEADGVPQSDLVLSASSARDGQAALGEHFPAGSGSPAQIITPESSLQEVTDRLLSQDGIDSVAVSSEGSPAGTAPVTEEGIQAQGPPGTPAPEPTVVDGDVLVQATLSDAPDSAAAETTVRQVREDLAAQDLDA